VSYLWAGYVITWLAVAWFAWRLERRAGRVARHLRALEDGPGEDAGGARRERPESEDDA
jgi:CcmD family protein